MSNIKMSLTVLSLIGLLLNGCSENTSDSGSNSLGAIPTDVTVERGAVYDASVTDTEGNIATQKASQNIYTFEDIPVYPITVIGGWIDVDADGQKTVNDVELSLPMYSYSNIVTPVTTYIADLDESVRDSRLAELESSLGVSAAELLKLPSNSIQTAVIAQNALYSEIVKNDNNISAIDMTLVQSTFSDLNITASQSSGSTDAELRVLLEQTVLDELILADKVTRVSLDSSNMSSTEKDTYLLNTKDFTMSNSWSDFTSITDANLSSDYTSSTITIAGIDSPLSISISNNAFNIVKNGVSLSETNSSVSSGDTIALALTTSGSFDVVNSVFISVENEFSPELTQAMNYTDAVSTCGAAGLQLPTSTQLLAYQSNNTTVLNYDNYWVSDPHSWSGYGNTYTLTTQTIARTHESISSGVICTKTYAPINYTVTTKSDPNQAPVAVAGADAKVYYTDAVTLDASLSNDDTGIVSYEWMEGTTLLSNTVSFSKSDFSIGTHDITLNVTDDGGKTSLDTITIVIYDTFTDILPMAEVGSVKSISSSSTGGLATITLGSGSQLYFKITNDLGREFTVSSFEIVSTYNGVDTIRASSTDAALLSGGVLSDGEFISLGYSLSSSQTANYWIGTYTLTDVATGTTFTNSYKWAGSSW